MLQKKMYPKLYPKKFVLDVARLTQVAAFKFQPVPAFSNSSLKRQEFGCLSATEDQEFRHYSVWHESPQMTCCRLPESNPSKKPQVACFSHS